MVVINEDSTSIVLHCTNTNELLFLMDTSQKKDC